MTHRHQVLSFLAPFPVPAAILGGGVMLATWLDPSHLDAWAVMILGGAGLVALRAFTVDLVRQVQAEHKGWRDAAEKHNEGLDALVQKKVEERFDRANPAADEAHTQHHLDIEADLWAIRESAFRGHVLFPARGRWPPTLKAPKP